MLVVRFAKILSMRVEISDKEINSRQDCGKLLPQS